MAGSIVYICSGIGCEGGAGYKGGSGLSLLINYLNWLVKNMADELFDDDPPYLL